MAKRRRGVAWRLLRGLLLALGAWVAITVATVIALRWIDPPSTMFMVTDRLTHLPDDDYTFRHDWRDWADISKHAAIAVIAAEDQRFPQHRGFDFKQIDKALADLERGRRMRGASTISQQVAKNLFLWRGQSWFRKGLEAGITLLIEACWSKQRILEVYLNVAEFGRGTYGVQAASQRFFRKDARRLTRSEAALLAAVLPAPGRFKVQAPTPYVKRRQAWIQRQMAALGGTAYLARLD
ncbi:MAG TPA: monofunctional biosynthetic peptidoglycan transglycosylase [Steroidobacteraceae bacterium]|nr:monofunctional biosynthetic peptidoglycan transglycosylase [Steroidobacteraceae bacterium]